jgi:hypothetical protein
VVENSDYNVSKISIAIEKMGEILDVMTENQEIVNAEFKEVDDNTYQKAKKSLPKISTLLSETRKSLTDSKEEIYDIDIDLFKTGKLSFSKMEILMNRLRTESSLLESIFLLEGYARDFQVLAKRKSDNEWVEKIFVFEKQIQLIKDFIRFDWEKFRVRLENCNVYNQNVISVKAFRTALASMFVSVLALIAVGLQILQILKMI